MRQILSPAIAEGFMFEAHAALWDVASTPREAIELALKPVDITTFPQKIH